MRDFLNEGTLVRLPGEEYYKIIGKPIGEGGGSLLYPAVRLMYTKDGAVTESELNFVLKECYPISSEYTFVRSDTGEIVPDPISTESISYLHSVQKMLLDEQKITAKIYHTGFRLTPTLNSAVSVDLSFDDGNTFTSVNNTVTIMESLVNKGRSLNSYLKGKRQLPCGQAFRIIEQVLFAVKEVHSAGFLHLDIQDSNIFIKGSLDDHSDFASLIDFGSSRALLEDGKCATISDRVIFSTQGFAAPEMFLKNDGTLRLGPEADIYSIGYLFLLLLTGQHYDSNELLANTSGHYLTKFKLRKIHCPSHLVEKMQQILARCLKPEPKERYVSTDEMLKDVSDFIKALQPYRSELSDTTYDAFICYKHGPVDSVVAKQLQERLEHFHTLQIAKEKEKIHRVFVDEGELSSCSDFGLQIREALKNAAWLIVICSPETKDSPWVNLEIQTFLEFHDRSRILAVMTNGEPADIFPDELLGDNKNANEVLAADSRGDSLKDVLKKLKKEALLRIAAPLLGTTYDSLKQRQKTYVFQRAAIFSGIAAALLIAFTAHTLWQSAQINEQYEQARRNQARYLSSISLDLFQSGDREKALLTALAIAPKDDSDGAVVPEQMYALNTALDSYNPGLKYFYAPTYVGEITNISQGKLSPEGDYYAAIDQYGKAFF